MRTRFKLILLFLVAASVLTARDLTLMQESRRGNHLEGCDQTVIKQIKHACYAAVGIQTNNETVCESIGSPDERYRCLGIVGGDPAACGRIEHTDTRDFCHYHVATRTKNKSLCEKIENQKHKNDCYGMTDRKQ